MCVVCVRTEILQTLSGTGLKKNSKDAESKLRVMIYDESGGFLQPRQEVTA